MQTSPDLQSERQARDSGIKKVADNNKEWMRVSLIHVKNMRKEYSTVTGEDIRFWVLRWYVAPTNAHAWGALTRAAVRTGLLEDTGTVKQMIAKGSHARRTPIWKFAQ